MFLRLLEVGGIVYGREIDLIDALLLVAPSVLVGIINDGTASDFGQAADVDGCRLRTALLDDDVPLVAAVQWRSCSCCNVRLRGRAVRRRAGWS